MSNKKKPKKLRTPNVPVTAGGLSGASAAATAAPARGGSQELSSQSRLTRTAPVVQTEFDYTYVKKDLNRIALLAGSFIVALVILSFIIK